MSNITAHVLCQLRKWPYILLMESTPSAKDKLARIRGSDRKGREEQMYRLMNSHTLAAIMPSPNNLGRASVLRHVITPFYWVNLQVSTDSICLALSQLHTSALGVFCPHLGSWLLFTAHLRPSGLLMLC
jgi:hypothetical protein